MWLVVDIDFSILSYIVGDDYAVPVCGLTFPYVQLGSEKNPQQMSDNHRQYNLFFFTRGELYAFQSYAQLQAPNGSTRWGCWWNAVEMEVCTNESSQK